MHCTENEQVFFDRKDAGNKLAAKLINYPPDSSILLAIPKGGIPVAAEVSTQLGITLDLIVVRKIPVPWNTEAGFGAVTDDGTVVLNKTMLEGLELSKNEIEQAVKAVNSEIQRRRLVLSGESPPLELQGKTAILVDDGLASGFTMIAAIRSARKRLAGKIVVAVPVASQRAVEIVRPESDDFITLIISSTFNFAVASFYRNWYDIGDEEAVNLLNEIRHKRKKKN